jgi:hypothetical protein
MEIVKGLIICFAFVLFIFGISTPQSKTTKCDTCQTILTKEDSLIIEKELKRAIDSFVAAKKKELSRVEDTIKKIEKKIK